VVMGTEWLFGVIRLLMIPTGSMGEPAAARVAGVARSVGSYYRGTEPSRRGWGGVTIGHCSRIGRAIFAPTRSISIRLADSEPAAAVDDICG
jgi:hypothetical protein